MANMYFGAYDYTSLPAITGDWNTVSNWYYSPGASGNCCCAGTPGTPAGRVPTTADTVIVIASITTQYSGGNWSGLVTVESSGTLGVGTYSNTVTVYGTVSNCTFNGAFNYNQNFPAVDCTFNGSLAPISGGILNIDSGCVVNGTITAGTSLNISGGTFNTEIPSRFQSYVISGGVFDRDLNLGNSLGNLTGFPQAITLNTGLSTNRNINIDITKYVYNIYLGRNIGGSLTINGGTYTGLISAVSSEYSPDASGREPVIINDGTYSPPVVITPASKSGNYMTFSPTALPIDWGFAAAGGTFSPTIHLSGTSNEILGAGLL